MKQKKTAEKPPRDPPKYSPSVDETEEKPKEKQYTKFFLMTYLPETEMWLELQAHSKSVKRYAYAYHDKDTWTEDVYKIDKETGETVLDDNGLPVVLHEKGTYKEPHFHLYLELHNNQKRYIGAVAKWFKEFHGENTFCRAVTKNAGACWKYLIHDSDECRKQGKFEYEPSIRQTNDSSYFERFDLPFQGDATLNALLDLRAGFSVFECCMKYGRDFIINYSKIKTVLEEIHWEEEHENA